MLVNIDLYVREKLFNTNDDDTNNYNKNDIIEGNNEKIMRIIYDYIHDNKITRPRFIHFFNKKWINTWTCFQI